MLEPIHKSTMLKQVRKTGKWEGFITGNKANPRSPWITPMSIRIELGQMQDRPHKFVVTTEGQRQPLERFINEFLYHTPRELGTTVRFWEGKQ